MIANIKESHIHAINDFCVGRFSRIQGRKLEALYNLIQKKGEPIQQGTSQEGDELTGVKALQYTDGQYIAILHTPIKKGNFYPCKIKTIQLTTL